MYKKASQFLKPARHQAAAQEIRHDTTKRHKLLMADLKRIDAEASKPKGRIVYSIKDKDFISI